MIDADHCACLGSCELLPPHISDLLAISYQTSAAWHC